MIHKPKTYLNQIIIFIINQLKICQSYKLNYFSLALLSLLFGFFISTGLSTVATQTGDWSIIAAAIITTNQELISKINYQNRNKVKSKYTYHYPITIGLKYCNLIKIGILYGLFVDAFKLGS